MYGGPHSRGFDPRFDPVRAENLVGVATLKIASRGTTGQSKSFQNDVYGKLGQVDLGDVTSTIRELGFGVYETKTLVLGRGWVYWWKCMKRKLLFRFWS